MQVCAFQHCYIATLQKQCQSWSAKFSQQNYVELKSGHSKISFPLLTLESFNNRDGVAEPSRRVGFHLWLLSRVDCRRNPMFCKVIFRKYVCSTPGCVVVTHMLWSRIFLYLSSHLVGNLSYKLIRTLKIIGGPGRVFRCSVWNFYP